MILSGLANYCEESWLQNKYPSLEIGYFDLEDGIPTNIQLEEIIAQAIN